MTKAFVALSPVANPALRIAELSVDEMNLCWGECAA